MNYEHDIKTLLTIGENIVIEFKRAGNGPEHDTYESIEKMGRETTEKATLQTTLQITLRTTLQGTTLKIAQLMLSHPEIKIVEIASTVGLTRDGVNYQIRKLKKLVGLRHEGADQAGHWEFASEESSNLRASASRREDNDIRSGGQCT